MNKRKRKSYLSELASYLWVFKLSGPLRGIPNRHTLPHPQPRGRGPHGPSGRNVRGRRAAALTPGHHLHLQMGRLGCQTPRPQSWNLKLSPDKLWPVCFNQCTTS